MPAANIHTSRVSLAGLFVAAALAASGCAFGSGSGHAGHAHAGAAATPARINHLVFFSLKDPADAPGLIDDCRERLATIPGVTSLFCGEHFEAGRDNVLADYDVGLYVGLASPEAYSAYLTHPNHLALVAEWGPRFESYRVCDIEDRTAR